MTQERKITRNILIQILGKVLSTLIGLLVVGLITRYLGAKGGFGRYTTVMAYLQFAGILADWGLSLVIVQMIAERPEDEEKIVNNIFSFRIISALCLFMIAVSLAWLLPYDALIRIGIAITAVGFLAISLNQLLIGVFQSKLAMGKVAVAEIMGRLILLLMTALVVWCDLGLSAILLATTIGALTNFFTNYYFTRKWLQIQFVFDPAFWCIIWHKTWPIALSIIFNLIYFKADTLILSLSQDLTDTGLYGAAYKVLEVLITLPYLFLGLLLPFMTTYWVKKQTAQFHAIAQNAFDAMSLMALPMVFGAILLGRQIMTLVAGQDFIIAGDILKILVVATAFIFLSNVFTHIIVAIDAQKKILPGFIVVAVVALTGYLIFIPRYSYWAAAWMTVVSEGLILMIAAMVVSHLTHFRPQLKPFLKALFASLIMSGIIWAFMFLHAPFLITFFGAVVSYPLLLILFGVVSKKFVFDIVKLKN